jgi:cytochrome b pre-mRNA-processing protein 3
LATLLQRIFRPRADTGAPMALYNAVVAEARRPHWYRDGQVPDTLDGRFDMVSTVLALVLLRLETLDEPAREPSARLTELFVTDMDGQLRQHGIGDLVVGKHVGRMMGQLGGRLAAYREGLAEGGDLPGAIARNIYRGAAVPAASETHVEQGLRALWAGLSARDLTLILGGDIA